MYRHTFSFKLSPTSLHIHTQIYIKPHSYPHLYTTTKLTYSQSHSFTKIHKYLHARAHTHTHAPNHSPSLMHPLHPTCYTLSHTLSNISHTYTNPHTGRHSFTHCSLSLPPWFLCPSSASGWPYAPNPHVLIRFLNFQKLQKRSHIIQKGKVETLCVSVVWDPQGLLKHRALEGSVSTSGWGL